MGNRQSPEDHLELRSIDLLEEIDRAVEEPLQMDIADVQYDREFDRFLVTLDIGIMSFKTFFRIEKLDELTDALRVLKENQTD